MLGHTSSSRCAHVLAGDRYKEKCGSQAVTSAQVCLRPVQSRRPLPLGLRQVWHFKPTVETALAKEKDLLAGAEGPTIAVHLRGGDKRQENADLVRGRHTTVLQVGVSKCARPTLAARLQRGCLDPVNFAMRMVPTFLPVMFTQALASACPLS